MTSTRNFSRAQDDTAEAHHQRGVTHHNRRCLDDASREYARTLELEPPRELTAAEWQLVRRFAPRIYTTPTEFFRSKTSPSFCIRLRARSLITSSGKTTLISLKTTTPAITN
jgi:hypothetical protein